MYSFIGGLTHLIYLKQGTSYDVCQVTIKGPQKTMMSLTFKWS